MCLTLDACGGPGGSGVDIDLVDMLISRQVPFTAFLNSRWVEANPDLTDRLAACPTVEIANHGTSHLPLSDLSERCRRLSACLFATRM